MVQKIELSLFSDSNNITNESEAIKDRFKTSSFSFETHYIIDYIARYIRKEKAHKNQYKETEKKYRVTQLIIAIASPEYELMKYDETRHIVCRLIDPYLDIQILRGKQRTEAFLSIIYKASESFEELIPNIKDTFKRAIDSFRDENYKNIWIHQKKVLKGIGTVKLICELSIFEFKLDLVVEDKNEIYRKNIFTTMPDSIFYYQTFKSLVIDDDKISITDRIFEKPFFTISIDDIKKNGEGVFIDFEGEVEKATPWWSDFRTCIETTDDIPCPS